MRAWLALVAYFSGLLPYVEAIPRNLAYLLVLAALTTLAVVLLWSPRAAADLRARSYREWMLWLLVSHEVSVQTLLLLQGDIHVTGAFKAGAYVGVCVVVFLGVTYALEGHRPLLWGSLSALGAGLSACSLWISFRGSLTLGSLVFRAQPWRIPLLGLPPTSSLFEDENYAAVVLFVCLMGTLFSLLLTRYRSLKVMLVGAAGLTGMGLLLTHSRAAYLGLVVATLSGYLADLGRLKRLFALALMVAVGLLVFDLTQASKGANQFLEVHRGLTGRMGLWGYVLERIAERPLLGYGVGNVAEVIQEGPGSWQSSHNSFLDFALMFGIPTTLVYIVFLFSCLNQIRFLPMDHRERSLLLGASLGLLVIANFTTHTLGGVSFGSLSLGLFLGLPGAVSLRHRRRPGGPR